jgi:hypothetical protein
LKSAPRHFFCFMEHNLPNDRYETTKKINNQIFLSLIRGSSCVHSNKLRIEKPTRIEFFFC